MGNFNAVWTGSSKHFHLLKIIDKKMREAEKMETGKEVKWGEKQKEESVEEQTSGWEKA